MGMVAPKVQKRRFGEEGDFFYFCRPSAVRFLRGAADRSSIDPVAQLNRAPAF